MQRTLETEARGTGHQGKLEQAARTLSFRAAWQVPRREEEHTFQAEASACKDRKTGKRNRQEMSRTFWGNVWK